MGAVTREACGVGAFSTANIVLETAAVRCEKVFGRLLRRQRKPAATRPNDFIGVSVQLRAHSPAVCSTENNGAVAGPAAG